MKVVKSSTFDDKNNKKSFLVAPQQVGASFVNNITSVVQKTTDSVKKTQTNTTTKTVTTQSVHYQPQIEKVDSFIDYFDNAIKYIDNAINNLNEGLIVNDTKPFSDKTSTIKTNMSNLRNILKTEILPELNKSR